MHNLPGPLRIIAKLLRGSCRKLGVRVVNFDDVELSY